MRKEAVWFWIGRGCKRNNKKKVKRHNTIHVWASLGEREKRKFNFTLLSTQSTHSSLISTPSLKSFTLIFSLLWSCRSFIWTCSKLIAYFIFFHRLGLVAVVVACKKWDKCIFIVEQLLNYVVDVGVCFEMRTRRKKFSRVKLKFCEISHKSEIEKKTEKWSWKSRVSEPIRRELIF